MRDAIRAGTQPTSSAGIIFIGGPIDVFVGSIDGKAERKISPASSYFLSVHQPTIGSRAVFTGVSGAESTYNKLQIYTVDMNDSTAIVQVTNEAEDHWEAQMSSDGSRIVFDKYVDSCACFQLAMVSATGGDERVIVPTDTVSQPLAQMDIYTPTFKPDGSIVFQDSKTEFLYSIKPDGTGLTQLTTFQATLPSVSKDGTKIVFERDFQTESGWTWETWIMNSDGTDPKLLLADAWDPLFVNDKIVFLADFDTPNVDEIYMMNMDGTQVTRLTNNGLEDFFLW